VGAVRLSLSLPLFTLFLGWTFEIRISDCQALIAAMPTPRLICDQCIALYRYLPTPLLSAFLLFLFEMIETRERRVAPGSASRSPLAVFLQLLPSLSQFSNALRCWFSSFPAVPCTRHLFIHFVHGFFLPDLFRVRTRHWIWRGAVGR
jgi:hypothetical protein